MQDLIKKQNDFFTEVCSSIDQEPTPDNIHQNLLVVKHLLTNESDYDFVQLKELSVQLVFRLRGKIIQELSAPVEPDRFGMLETFIVHSPSYGVEGHEKFLKELEIKKNFYIK